MVEKAVGRIGAAAALCTGKLALSGGMSSKTKQRLGKPSLACQQRFGVDRCFDPLRRGFQKRRQFVGPDREPGVPQFAAAGPVGRDAFQPCTLKRFGSLKAQRILEQESYPGLQVFGGPILALRREPGYFDVHFVGTKQWLSAPAAKSDQHTGPGKLPHCRLRNRRTGTEKNSCGIGDGYVPVQRLAALLREGLDSSTIDQNPTVLQVIDIGSFRVENGFQIAGRFHNSTGAV